MKIKRKFINRYFILILFIIAIAMGITFAFLQDQIQNEATTDLRLSLTTVDSLTFSTTGSLNLQATAENMGKGKSSLHGSAVAQAKLISESHRDYEYYLYLSISENDFIYTTDDKKPELILKITDPMGEEVKQLGGDEDLPYHYKREDDANDVSGFDLTGVHGLIPITLAYKITTKDMDITQVTHNWQFDLYFVNFLDSNQVANSGNSFDANFLIKKNEYNPLEINVLGTSTTDSISLNVMTTNGDGEIAKYMYSKDAGRNYTTIDSSEVEDNFTFEGLTSDTEYNIWVQAVDTNEISSNVFQNIISTGYIEPKATDIKITDVDAKKMKVTLSATAGSRALDKYYFKINNDSSTMQRGNEFEEKDSNVYVFDALGIGDYTVEAYATDIKGHTTENIKATYETAKIDSVEMDILSNTSVKINVRGIEKSAPIAKYYISIDGGSSYQEIVSGAEEVSYTYNNIDLKSISEIRVYTIDQNGRISQEKIKGIDSISVNFEGNGNVVSQNHVSCSLVEGQSSCNIITPTISAPSSTSNVIGFSAGANDHQKVFGSGQEITITLADNGKTYYAQTKSNDIVRTITFNPNNNAGFVYAGKTYTSTQTFNLCTIAATYNGVAQGNSCSGSITMPTINPSGNTPSVIGWNAQAGVHTATYTAGQAVTLTATGNLTYYAQTQKTQVTYTVYFNANGNSINATSKSCSIAPTYNGTGQDNKCNVTTPVISAPTATPNIVGFNQTASATTSQVGSNSTLTVNSSNNGKTYFAITRNANVTYTVNFKAGSHTSSVGAASGSCTIPMTYNGKARGTTCTVTTPAINPASGYVSVGWSTTNGATSGTAAGSSITLSASGTTYYGNSLISISWTKAALWYDGATYAKSCLGTTFNYVFTFRITVAPGVSIKSGSMCMAYSSASHTDYCGTWHTDKNTNAGHACFNRKTGKNYWTFHRQGGCVWAKVCDSTSKCLTTTLCA